MWLPRPHADCMLLICLIVACTARPMHALSISGVVCTPHALLPGGVPCPVLDSCLPNSSCVTWQQCALQPDVAAAAALLRRQAVHPPCHHFDADGSFVNEQWATPSCSLNTSWLSPDEMYYRLQNRHIAISGDSMQRQVFMRLVWYLRGLTSVVEHFYHRDAIYVRNASTDLFWTSWPEHFRPDDAEHPSQRASIDNPEIIVQFFWDVSAERTSYADVLTAFKGTGSFHHVYAPAIHYWRKENCSNTSDLQSLAEISHERIGQGHPRVFYITTPLVALIDGDEVQRGVHTAQLQRNALFRAGVPQFGGRIIPLDLMAATGTFKNSDGLHYGCKYDRDSWKDVEASDFRRPPGFGEPLGADCRDMMNLNVVQMLVSAS